MINLFKLNIPKFIIPITIIAVVLNILRVILWDKISFIFILWNIFLALIPFIISSYLLIYSKKEKVNKIILILGFILWLLFIPNAPYIITDFIHLGEARAVPLIFDILLLFSSSLIGLWLCLSSLFHIEQIIKNKYNPKLTSIIMGFIILLISFGIYLGRYLRFNSWDIFINHTSLIKNIWKIFSEPSMYTGVYLYTGLLFFFIFLFYKSYKYSIKND
jgi:uncharacterized membrane protein